MKERYLVAITGASGVGYGMNLIRNMHKMGLDLDVVLSEPAREIIRFELEVEPDELEKYAVNTYSNNDLFSPPASGSVMYDAMIIVPCSLTTAGKINAGVADNLIARAAQVTMKEARRLIIVPRETPLSTIQLKVIYSLSRAGVIVVPASPGFYHHPGTISDLEDFMTQKIMGLLCKNPHLIKPFHGKGAKYPPK